MKALVTRPRDDALDLARALLARGITPLVAPMLTIKPIPDAARRLADSLVGAQAVLFTSANGVRAFAAASTRRELPAFAVGDASAAAARLTDFRGVASAGGDVEDLATLVAARLSPRNGALVHAAGTAVAGDLDGRLGALGFTLRRAVIYEAVPVAALDEATGASLRRGEVAFALFFSPRTAATFVTLAAAAGLAESCGPMVAVALSPAVATTLKTLPWRDVRIAAAPTQRDLLAALDDVLAERAARPLAGGA